MRDLMGLKRERNRSGGPDARFRFLTWFFLALAALIVLRLGYLQVMQYGFYALLASDQHDLQTKLNPVRGQILVRDRTDGSLHPLAGNRLVWQVYAVPKDIKDATSTGRALATTLKLPEEEIIAKLTKQQDDPYERLANEVDADTVKVLRDQNLDGVGSVEMPARFYPEKNMGGQLIGYVAADEHGAFKGKYGLESNYDKVLAGVPGSLSAEKDAGGRRIAVGDNQLQAAVNGSDIILTIDPAIQYQACTSIQNAVRRHGADSGSIIIMDPQTGAIMAMCSAPDFDPAEYGKIKDLYVLNNPAVFGSYEPGSVFKPITLAAGLDAEKISPKTTYNDTGVEEIDGFKIKNSDNLGHGIQSMVDVLDKSLNTGTIFVQRQLGKDMFRRYIENFGFGAKTGIDLAPESKGDISGLAKKGSVFAATGSFGQGISVTPLQLVSGYAALANGGKLMRPYVVDEIVHPDGSREKTKPKVIGQPITSRASRLIGGMLVSVVENGHGKRAGVPGYWVGGKTGTAQVPKTDGPGYDPNITIGSFAGYAPASDPKFVMLVKIDHPRDVEWAESSAAPVFGEMAKFLLSYLEVPPERAVGKVKPVVVPASTQPVQKSEVRI
jgi:cell division protein FtsI/penicillin-binding protein 2